MKTCGIEISDEINCWCGLRAKYHHTSSVNRKDGKMTVWYKCSDGHRNYTEIQFKSVKVPKPIKKKGDKNEKPENEMSS